MFVFASQIITSTLRNVLHPDNVILNYKHIVYFILIKYTFWLTMNINDVCYNYFNNYFMCIYYKYFDNFDYFNNVLNITC